MALNVLARGRPGRIELEDRSDSPSLIVLLSEGSNPREPTGTVLGPSEGGADDDDIWITFGLERLGGEEPFRIQVDTTELPGGPLLFRKGSFVERARAEAERQQTYGEARAKLTLDNAADWGLEG